MIQSAILPLAQRAPICEPDAPLVLVADDEPLIRTLIESVLAMLGYRVRVAEDGLAALRADGAEPVDLLVSDIQMPLLQGPALASALRERRPGVPVLFLSGMPDGEAVVRRAGLEAPCWFLEKPFELRDLVGAVDALLCGTPSSARMQRA